MEGIKNIIFDLGGVLLNIDYSKTIEGFAVLGLADPERAFSEEIQSSLFQKLECGMISNRDFLNQLRTRIPKASLSEIENAWNAMLLDFPAHRFQRLKRLSAHYRLFVLSNTNRIHLKAFKIIIDKSVGWQNFQALFDGICYSHVLKVRKPNAAIFRKVISLYSLHPADTLFIDDTEAHVIAAASLGIRAIHLKDSVDISEVLADY